MSEPEVAPATDLTFQCVQCLADDHAHCEHPPEANGFHCHPCIPRAADRREQTPENPNGNTRTLRRILEARFAAKKEELLEIRRQINDVQKRCRHIGAIHDCGDCGAQDV